MSDRAASIRERVNIVDVIGKVVPLKRKGAVHFGKCPFHADNTPSLAVDEGKQLYRCHGCGVGGDVIRFVESHYKMDFKAALEFLGADVREKANEKPFQRKIAAPVPEWVPSDPPRGAFADEIGQHDKVWVYKSDQGKPLFYIRRRDANGKKEIKPLSWGKLSGVEGWHAKHYPVPRPLYNLDLLTRMNDREVIVVEGEKAADAAARLFPGSVVTTWAGGSNSVGQAEWEPLSRRRVLLWPDADAPGEKAMAEVAAILHAQGCVIRTCLVGDKPKGWDAADAEADGWTNSKTGEWVGANSEPYDPLPMFDPLPVADEDEPPLWGEEPPPIGEIVQTAPEPDDPRILNGGKEYPTWMAGIPNITKGGHPVGNEANAVYCLAHCPETANRLVFDEFRKVMLVTAPMPWNSGGHYPRAWTDLDDVSMAVYFQRMGIPLKVTHATHAASMIAYMNQVHPVRSYLHGLEWDGVPRLDTLMTEYVKPGDDWTPAVEAYRQQVGRKWMIQAVARIMDPGCQADATLVVEGQQGLGKSSLFRALGGEWYTDDMPTLGTKDASDNVTSAWIVELSELSAMRRSDVESVKAFLTRRVDRFRPPYGRKTIEVARQAVFCATCNDTEWLEDRTGGRRFFPVTAIEIDVAAVRRDRDQLWAEAVAGYESREDWYVSDAAITATARDEQQSRVTEDPWKDGLRELMTQRRIHMHDALQAVGVPGKDRTPAHTKRIARILADAGYSRKRTKAERYYER